MHAGRYRRVVRNQPMNINACRTLPVRIFFFGRLGESHNDQTPPNRFGTHVAFHSRDLFPPFTLSTWKRTDGASFQTDDYPIYVPLDVHKITVLCHMYEAACRRRVHFPPLKAFNAFTMGITVTNIGAEVDWCPIFCFLVHCCGQEDPHCAGSRSPCVGSAGLLNIVHLTIL